MSMQEIAPKIFIETDYPGVVLGILNWSKGPVLVDSPFRPDDIRIWRASVQKFGDAPECLLINLDDHYDRTLGSRQIDCTVLGHEKLPQLLRDRPVNIKPQGIETGADWELHSAPGNIRWSAPEITFNERMEVHCERDTLILDYRPGPSQAAIWATLPVEKIVFVGDAVMPGSVPFFANADIPQWIDTLDLLLKPEYKNFRIVSSRCGTVTVNDVKNQVKVLGKIAKHVEKLASKPLRNEDLQKTANRILNDCDVPSSREVQNLQRARYGLSQYLRRSVGPQLEQIAAF
jgi:glyoxylase-like metal-dependent hydrolase (beta-lactamase superfamily II)